MNSRTGRNVIWGFLLIYLDTYMLCRVYQASGICIRNYCGAEPPRDTQSPSVVPTVGGRDRAPASYDAANRIQAPARTKGGRFCGIDGGRTAPSLPAKSGTTSGAGGLAGSIPPVLVRPCGCSRTPPRPRGSIERGSSKANKEEDTEKGGARQPANVTKEKCNENQSDQRVRG